MARLKKRLPRNFGEAVESGDLTAFQAVFDSHALDAVDLSKTPALSTYAITEEMIRWLVARGADLEQGDAYGETALHHHSRSWNGLPAVLIELGAAVEARDMRGETPLFGARIHPANVAVLLSAGANVRARNNEGQTPLEQWLTRSGTGSLIELEQCVQLIVDAGAEVSAHACEAVSDLSLEYARIREDYNADSLAAADAAISSLCRLASIDAAAPIVRHDGISPITVSATEWVEQYEELFQQLVPPTGNASTVQGEAIRVATRILNEIEGSGAVNWDSDFRLMVDCLSELFGSGDPLTASQLSRLAELTRLLRNGRAPDSEAHELVRFAVAWAVAHPEPIALPTMPYRR